MSRSGAPLASNVSSPVLTTERLILRPVQREDFEPWCAFMADERTAKYVGGVRTRAEVWRAFTSMAGAWALYGVGMFSVVERATGRWVGRLGPWHPEGWPGTEVGWGIVYDAQGKGYATEGSRRAMAFAFDVLQWDEVIHCIDPTNTASQRVAARLGSVNQGPCTLPAPFRDARVDRWAQTRETFRQGGAAR
jgi:RimJ/RimL family protein N-acetyltransferase